MSALTKFYHWFDIRPGERRGLWLSFFGAFLVMAALTLGRSLREGLYLAYFDIESLPYITAAYAFLSLPVVSLFTRLLEGGLPRRVLGGAVLLQGAGILVLWILAAQDFFIRALIVAFYLWSAIGILLIASGFWIVTAELFPVRGAKRLFGMISAGGTAGAMLMGISLGWLTGQFRLIYLLPLLIVLLLLFLLIQSFLPRKTSGPEHQATARSATADNAALVWRNPHLRIIALIVVTATVASTLVDFQFKEAARATYSTQEDLTSFFGAFYGWTGAVALLIQLLVSARLTARAGVGAALAVLPVLLLFGSGAFMLLPGLVLATLLRGADNSLRKSLFRPVLEYLYVPLAAGIRRRTKVFIDSVVDSLAEGLGALFVFVWVTWLALPSLALSVSVIALAILFLILSRRMDRQYLSTIVTRLKEGEEAAEDLIASSEQSDHRLLSATFSQMDLRSILMEAGTLDLERATSRGEERESVEEENLLAQLRSLNESVVRRALSRVDECDEACIGAVIRLLARDTLLEDVVKALAALDEKAVPQLARSLKEESTDFVIRRRVPRILARCGGRDAADSLLAALNTKRFEVRYRSAVALVQRRRRKLPEPRGDWQGRIWDIILSELRRDRPVWELQRLLDAEELGADDLVQQRIGVRGELSLEHTFRLLSLVLEPEPVKAAFNGVLLDDENLKNFALEYLDQVLPPDIHRRLWYFIGDVSEHQRRKGERSLNNVVSDLMNSQATLFAGDLDKESLRRLLDEQKKPED